MKLGVSTPSSGASRREIAGRRDAEEDVERLVQENPLRSHALRVRWPVRGGRGVSRGVDLIGADPADNRVLRRPCRRRRRDRHRRSPCACPCRGAAPPTNARIPLAERVRQHALVPILWSESDALEPARASGWLACLAGLEQVPMCHTRSHTQMIKTTVYLPEPLKRQLQRLAKRVGRSEAQLIRDAVERVVQEQPTPPPRLPLFTSNDPDLAERVDEALTGFGQ
jgi:hypothetical protein